jgi:hypothetical protein
MARRRGEDAWKRSDYEECVCSDDRLGVADCRTGKQRTGFVDRRCNIWQYTDVVEE